MLTYNRPYYPGESLLKQEQRPKRIPFSIGFKIRHELGDASEYNT